MHQWWAREILDGKLLRERAFYQSPFYPYLLALIYKLFGIHPMTALWLQAAAGAASCAALLRATARLFGEKAGLWAGVMAAFYRPFLFHGVFFLKETWLVLALSLFVLAALRLEAAGRRRDAFWSGLALGLAALSKGNVLCLAPVLPASLLIRKAPQPGLGLSAFFLLGLALPILPATLHNYAAGRDFVLINYTSGFSFFIGNNPEATGSTRYPLNISSHPLEEEKQSTALAQEETGRTLAASEVSRFYVRKGLAFIRREPGRWLSLTLFKFMLFWNKYELPDNYDLSFIQARTKTILSWPLFSFQWVASFAAAGLVLLKGGRSLRVLGALYMLSVVLTYVTDRYRLPMAVFLIPFAAGALARLTPAALPELRRDALNPLALCLAAPILLLCNITLLRRTAYDESQGWVNLAQVYYDRADYENALDSFYQAVRAEPERMAEAAFLCGGAAAEKTGRTNEAFTIYRAGLEVHPDAALLRERRDRLLRSSTR
ncbi:MAG: hypothetical protein A2V88_01240 [Elusimicrobia bacterium RBG_16_66_12]|nr:MAG: hypothetical protein A2V88_01240 [Elusimicrobia bacterium RBG_16_66_12]